MSIHNIVFYFLDNEQKQYKEIEKILESFNSKSIGFLELMQNTDNKKTTIAIIAELSDKENDIFGFIDAIYTWCNINNVSCVFTHKINKTFAINNKFVSS